MHTTTNTNSTEMKPDDHADRPAPGGEPWTSLSALTVEDLADLQWISAPKFARADRRTRKASPKHV